MNIKRVARNTYHKAGFTCRKKQKEYGRFCPYSFSHALSARYSVLHLLGVLSSGKKASLVQREVARVSVTEGL